MESLSLKRINRDLVHFPFEINENYIVNFEYNNLKISFYLNSDYPFKPPLIYLDSKLLNYKYNYFPPRIFNLYINSGNKCPCCNNLTCYPRWSPTFSILNILDEYKLIKSTMVSIYKKHITSFIIDLPDDVIQIIKEYI